MIIRPTLLIAGLWLFQSYAQNHQLLADAQSGKADAQFELAHQYALQGPYDQMVQEQSTDSIETIAENYHQAKYWYQQAEKNGKDAEIELEFVEYLIGLIEAAQRGGKSDQFNLALALDEGEAERGINMVLSDKLALVWYQKAAEQGHATAANNIGTIYEDGEGVEQSHSKAVTWYLKAAEMGNVTAMNNLGRYYFSGIGVEKSVEKSAKWYESAAKRGDSHAQFQLGGMYYFGQGVEQSEQRAIYWVKQSAEQGYLPAQNRLGVMFYYGIGTVADTNTAITWFTKTANADDAFLEEAIYNLAKSYLLQESYLKSLTTLQMLTEYEHYPPADYLQGRLYALGVTHDEAKVNLPIKAYQHFEKMAEIFIDGELQAYQMDKFNLLNAPKPLSGDTILSAGAVDEALVYLAEMNAQGIGREKDLRQAYQWISHASKTNPRAKKIKIGLEKRLAPQVIEAVKAKLP